MWEGWVWGWAQEAKGDFLKASDQGNGSEDGSRWQVTLIFRQRIQKTTDMD